MTTQHVVMLHPLQIFFQNPIEKAPSVAFLGFYSTVTYDKYWQYL